MKSFGFTRRSNSDSDVPQIHTSSFLSGILMSSLKFGMKSANGSSPSHNSFFSIACGNTIKGSRPVRCVISSQYGVFAERFSSIACMMNLRYVGRCRSWRSIKSARLSFTYPCLHSIVQSSVKAVPLSCRAQMSPCWPYVRLPLRTVALPPDVSVRQNISSCFPAVHQSDSCLLIFRSKALPFCLPIPFLLVTSLPLSFPLLSHHTVFLFCIRSVAPAPYISHTHHLSAASSHP